MKTLKIAVLFCLSLCVISSSYAWPYRGHGGSRVGFGVYINPLPLVFGAPYYGSNYYYGNPYYGYPQQVIVSAPTVVYSAPAPTTYTTYTSAPEAASYNTYEVQTAQPARPASGGTEWLYCSKPDGFYPAIKDCPGGWRKIVK